MRKRNFKILLGILFFGFAALLANLNKETYTPIAGSSVENFSSSQQSFQRPNYMLQFPSGIGEYPVESGGSYNIIPDLQLGGNSSSALSSVYIGKGNESASNGSHLAMNSSVYGSAVSDGGAAFLGFAPFSYSIVLPQKGKLFSGKKSESKNIARSTPFTSSLGGGPESIAVMPGAPTTPSDPVPLDSSAWIIIIGCISIGLLKLYLRTKADKKATLVKIHSYNRF